MKRIHLLVLAVSLLLLGGCASQQATTEQAQQYEDSKDPLESLNRTLWDFNYEVLDKYILRPTAVVYVDYMPQVARTGLLNMAENLEEPSNSLNNLLQGKLEGTFISLGRFMLNSTVGLLGVFDVATEIGLELEKESFGEVLGKWGVGTGPYLMIPAMGPSDIRSSAGDFVDSSYSPIDGLNFYLGALRMGINALEGRAALIQQEQTLNSSADPYAFVKSAYFQNLKFKVQDGVIKQSAEEEALEDDIDAFLEDL
ncbi:VacJ family lipoprotein [uncultured Paraglaciecola sp.]|uniref:MlaA family lipoprotein n=1 Tax=uncultured Paraglaciecola sp. TaxID=1765024 RepID=UPI002612FF0D|nr:VacJ family lipoprotein [uncultured Paraglaciecola sp.]